jgi:RNA polymerase sigma factor (sigma-70 family)
MGKVSGRIAAILSCKMKHFHHPDFDKPSLASRIVGDIPDKDKYDQERRKVENLQVKNKLPAMRPCYEEPLLTREQEYHLFKKMNYLKFMTARLRKKIRISRPDNELLTKLESMLNEIYSIRNQLASSNFRLAGMILKSDFRYSGEATPDLPLSDAYFDVLKSVDYFNYTLGNKFCTYCVWVLKKNFFRGIKIKKSKGDKHISLDENYEEYLLQSEESYDYLEMHQRENAKFINRTIGLVKNIVKSKDIKRQIRIIEEYYGINGRKRKNLEEISSTLGITKERVRQLKEKFLGSMRETLKRSGGDLDVI